MRGQPSLKTGTTKLTRFGAMLSRMAFLVIIPAFTAMIYAAAIQPALAVSPEEMLADPVLEDRARALSKELRCLVCQNQSIDDSDAELARDLRVDVRKRLSEGASDDEILTAISEVYGDYVLLRPPFSPRTYVLWATPLVIILLGGALIISTRRRTIISKTNDAPANPPTNPPVDKAEISTPPSAAPRSSAQKSSGDNRLAGALLCLIVAVSLVIYLMVGRADLGDAPLADRSDEIAAAAAASQKTEAGLNAALQTAREAVADDPDNVGKWLQLAMRAAAAADTDTEISALTQAEKMTAGDPAIKSLLAEALSRGADGQVTIPARRLIADALTANPNQPRALFLAGLAAYQDEEFARAVAIWQQLQTISSADAPWIDLLAENIADAAAAGGIDLAQDTAESGQVRGPDSTDIAAAAQMSDEDRTTMIAGMVDGLAARLAEDPSNAEGWQRLARAYQVLGNPVDAQRALIGAADAMAAKIQNTALTRTAIMADISALEHMVTHNLEADFADDATRLMLRLEQLGENRPELLYLQGHFAKLAGDIETARQRWNELLKRLPEGVPAASRLRKEITDL
ncbi:cytochrome c-type biogenesis protein CcmH [Alphaproteobacteria bacterium]|nr:cytochrome c-type biogenesis protein CcmH [Alphaproteobacteria bacterium]